MGKYSKKYIPAQHAATIPDSSCVVVQSILLNLSIFMVNKTILVVASACPLVFVVWKMF